jgi:hypothetical protein
VSDEPRNLKRRAQAQAHRAPSAVTQVVTARRTGSVSPPIENGVTPCSVSRGTLEN